MNPDYLRWQQVFTALRLAQESVDNFVRASLRAVWNLEPSCSVGVHRFLCACSSHDFELDGSCRGSQCPIHGPTLSKHRVCKVQICQQCFTTSLSVKQRCQSCGGKTVRCTAAPGNCTFNKGCQSCGKRWFRLRIPHAIEHTQQHREWEVKDESGACLLAVLGLDSQNDLARLAHVLRQLGYPGLEECGLIFSTLMTSVVIKLSDAEAKASIKSVSRLMRKMNHSEEMVERVENILDKHSVEETNDLLNLQTRASYLEELQKSNPSPAITRALQVTQRAIQSITNPSPSSSFSASSSSSSPSVSSSPSGEHLSLLENAEAKTDEVSSAPEAVVIVSRVKKAVNVGLIVRAAAAFGLSRVCLIGEPRLGARPRDSGSFARIPWNLVSVEELNQIFNRSERSLHFDQYRNLTECCASLKDEGFTIVGIEIAEGAKSVYAENAFPSQSAFLLGCESHGLLPEELKECQSFMYIPQYGTGVGSLNVAMAATVVFSQFGHAMKFSETARSGHKFVDGDENHKPLPMDDGGEENTHCIFSDEPLTGLHFSVS